MRKLLAATALAATGASLALPVPAFATLLTFTVQGTVTSFIDVDNVYGFGAGANLAGLAVNDVYTVDTTATTLSTGSGPYGPGSTYQEYYPGFGSATSTIGGHTITIDASNGYSLLEYNTQLVSPLQPYNQSLLELQVIGKETTGNDIGGEFLIRDEVVSYSLILPVPLNGLDLSTLNFDGAAAEGGGVFFPYVDGATAGDWNLTLYNSTAIPEPATWAMLMLGFASLGFAGYRASSKSAAFTA